MYNLELVDFRNMFLLINLSERNKIRLSLFDENANQQTEYDGRNRELLASIENFFIRQNFLKENLQGIMAVVGAGSFTNTRVSAVVANIFGFVLHIPLLAISTDQIEKAQSLISELLKQPKGQYVSATYSAPPNIG